MVLIRLLFLATAYLTVLATSAEASERAIVKEVIVSAARTDVWKTWSTTEGVTTFFSPNAHVELRLGGPFEIYFATDAKYGERGSEGCKVLSFVHEEMLSFSWNAPPHLLEERGQRSFVVVQLSDAGSGKTRVKLTHAGFGKGGKWDDVFAYFQRAWPAVLGNLKKRFEDGPLFEQSDRMKLKREKRSHYAYFLHPTRPEFLVKPNPKEIEAMRGHVGHIKKLLADSHLVLAGPCDGSAQYPTGANAVALKIPAPGIVVFTARDAAEAKAIMESDPAVKAGVFKACVLNFHYAYALP